jgi:hypothetical protein
VFIECVGHDLFRIVAIFVADLSKVLIDKLILHHIVSKFLAYKTRSINRVQKSPSLVPVWSPMNSFHTLLSRFYNIEFTNVVLLYLQLLTFRTAMHTRMSILNDS